MPRLLHIDASVLPSESVSRSVANAFRAEWKGEVIHRDLGARPVPHLTEAGVRARGTAPHERTPEQAAAAFLQDELVDELLSADAYLFAVPMYNFSIPSAFKAWLDQILVPGRTFGSGPEDSPIKGRPATLVAARGGSYGPGTPREGWDYAEPYLRRILCDVFGLDLHVIMPEMTLAEANPALADFRDHMRASVRKAHEEAAARARDLVPQDA
jgi:Acyl carrier protein phosphodiesterase